MNSVALCLELAAPERARLIGGLGNAQMLDCLTDGSHEDFCQCAIAFGNPPPDWLPGAERLQWVQLESVCFGEYADLDLPNVAPELTVTNLAGFFSDAVAETALAGILALGRGVDELALLRSRRKWLGDDLRPNLWLLRRAHVIMIGFGSINRQLADLLNPFDCQITPFRRGFRADDLDAALANADLVVCTTPDTPETRGLFSADRLALLKPGAVFVSLGRGSVVEETALANALTSAHLGGAVIDVTNDEPLPTGHPFWTTPNTILSQHTGGGTADEMDRKIDLFLDNLNRYQTGEPLVGTVDFSRGY